MVLGVYGWLNLLAQLFESWWEVVYFRLKYMALLAGDLALLDENCTVLLMLEISLCKGSYKLDQGLMFLTLKCFLCHNIVVLYWENLNVFFRFITLFRRLS